MRKKIITLFLIFSLSPLSMIEKGLENLEQKEKVRDLFQKEELSQKETFEKSIEKKGKEVINKLEEKEVKSNFLKESQEETGEKKENFFEAKFISPKEKEKIKGEIKIKFKLSRVKIVEVYLKQKPAQVPFYLGLAEKLEDDLWEILLNSEKFPNSLYEIYLKTKRFEKEVTIGGPTFEIENIILEKQLAPVFEKLESAQEKIKKTEKEIAKVVEETKESLISETREKVKEIEKILEPQKKEIAKRLIKEDLIKIEPEIKEQVKVISEKEKEKVKIELELDEKTSKKEKLEEKIENLTKEISKVDEIKPKVKKEFKEMINELKSEKLKQLKEKQTLKEKFSKEIEELTLKKEKIEKEKKRAKKEIESSIKSSLEKIEQISPAPLKEKIKIVKENISQKLSEFEEKIAQKEKEKQKELALLLKDSDSDGISDRDELRIGTDPLNPDTDSDGVLDGLEIKAGYDPKDPSPADKISYENPKKSKAPITENYKIEKVELKRKEDKEILVIRGKGLPNSFVTIYVFSLPLVLVTKTDEQGNFVYELDKPLELGVHQIFLAITDNKGKIIERSEAFHFIKTPVAVAAVLPASIPPELLSPTERLIKSSILLIFIFIIAGLTGAFAIINYLLKKKKG